MQDEALDQPPGHFHGRSEDVADEGLLVGDVLHLDPDLSVLGDQPRKVAGVPRGRLRFFKREYSET